MAEHTFKKLGEVEALPEVPEGANAFIEVNGEVKRVPGDGLGGGAILDKNGKLQNAVLPEGYPIKEIFYDIQWDGNAEGLDSFVLEQFTFYKVSDEVLTAEQLIGSTLRINGAAENGVPGTYYLDESVVMPVGDGEACVVAPMIPFVISTSVLNLTMNTYESAPETTLEFPSTGTYVLGMLDGASLYVAAADPTPLFVSRLFKHSVQHISQEYLPIKTAIIKDSEYDNALVGLQTMVTSGPEYECINMTFEEAYETMAMGNPLSCILMAAVDGCANVPGECMFVGTAMTGQPLIMLFFQLADPVSLYWTADGLSVDPPDGGK